MFRTLARDSLLSAVLYLAPRFSNVVFFILVGRLSNPTDAGIFSLAVTYLIIATTLMRGLDDLIVRQVAQEPHRALGYMTNFLLIRLGLSLLLYVIIKLIVQKLMNYENNTTLTILILTISVFPESLSYVIQSILFGIGQFGSPAVVMFLVSVFKVGFGAFALATGQSLMVIAWIWLIGSILGLVLLFWFAIRLIGRIRFTDLFDWSPFRDNWRAALPFIAITILTTIESQSDTVFLSAFRGETEVGWYWATTTIVFSFSMISQAVRTSVYPLMAKYVIDQPGKLIQLYGRLVRYLGIFIFPVVAGIFLISQQLIPLIYGVDFIPAVQVLEILIWVLVFLFLNVPLSRLMLVHNFQKWNMLFLLISVLLNISLNVLLDSLYGASGAAVARFVSIIFYFGINYLFVYKKIAPLNILRILIKPFLAALLMGVLVWPIRSEFIMIPIMIGVLVYLFSIRLMRVLTQEEVITIRRTLSNLSHWQR